MNEYTCYIIVADHTCEYSVNGNTTTSNHRVQCIQSSIFDSCTNDYVVYKA